MFLNTIDEVKKSHLGDKSDPHSNHMRTRIRSQILVLDHPSTSIVRVFFKLANDYLKTFRFASFFKLYICRKKTSIKKNRRRKNKWI